jgi:hypothetical protein
MKIGYATRQHVVFASRQKFEVTTNFNHLGEGGRFEPWLQRPWPLQHNETIAIDKLVS